MGVPSSALTEKHRSLQGTATLIRRPGLRRIPTRAVHLLRSLDKHKLCVTQMEGKQIMYAFVCWRSEVSGWVGIDVTKLDAFSP